MDLQLRASDQRSHDRQVAEGDERIRAVSV